MLAASPRGFHFLRLAKGSKGFDGGRSGFDGSIELLNRSERLAYLGPEPNGDRAQGLQNFLFRIGCGLFLIQSGPTDATPSA